MPRFHTTLPSSLAVLLFASALSAQSAIAPLATFGNGGWLAPGSSAYLTTGNTERGLAYNPVTGNLVLVSRAGGNNVRVLDGISGADLGGLDATGITGGTFAINMAGVGDDGAIYVGNLSTSATSPFKIYKWDSEALGLVTPPSVAYNATSGLPRTGDSFAVIGGTPALAAQFAAAGTSTLTNSFFAVGALDGTNASTAYLSVPGTTTASNDYRLALTFVDSNTLIGNQGGLARITAFAGTTAAVNATVPLSSAQRAMDYAVIGGTPVLAVLDSNSSLLSVYDISIPGAPVLVASANNTVAPLTANANATGSVQWGAITGNTAILYAMNTNQGIQAFSVTVQPAASARAFGSGCGSPALALSASAAPVLPSTIQLVVDNLPTTTLLGAYLFGFDGIPGGQPIPLAPACSQYVLPLATAIFVPLGATSFQSPQSYPADPAFAGLQIFAQAVAVDAPFSVLSTNGLRLYLETF